MVVGYYTGNVNALQLRIMVPIPYNNYAACVTTAMPVNTTTGSLNYPLSTADHLVRITDVTQQPQDLSNLKLRIVTNDATITKLHVQWYQPKFAGAFEGESTYAQPFDTGIITGQGYLCMWDEGDNLPVVFLEAYLPQTSCEPIGTSPPITYTGGMPFTWKPPPPPAGQQPAPPENGCNLNGTPFDILVVDEGGCGSDVEVLANSLQDAQSCAKASGWKPVTQLCAYEASFGGGEYLDFYSDSDDDAKTCAADSPAGCSNCSTSLTKGDCVAGPSVGRDGYQRRYPPQKVTH